MSPLFVFWGLVNGGYIMAIRVEDCKVDASVQQSIKLLLADYKLSLEAANRSRKTI